MAVDKQNISDVSPAESLQTRLAIQADMLKALEKRLFSYEDALVPLAKELAQNKAALAGPGKATVGPGQSDIGAPHDEMLMLRVNNASLKKKMEELSKIISWQKVELNQKTKSINNLQKLLTARQGNLLKADVIDSKQVRSQFSDENPISEKSLYSYKKGFVDLGEQLSAVFGNHRSGWGYAIINLAPLSHEEGIFLDTFIERTFVWRAGQIVPTLRPWIGFIHVPPNVPEWFQSEQSNDAIFSTNAWTESLPFCKGLFTLSAYHKKALEKKLDLPINALLHPTEVPQIKWQWEKFEKNPEKKIIQIGWWLRKLHAIFELPKSDYKKVFLRVTKDPYFMKLFAKERDIRKAEGTFNESMYETAETVEYLYDDDYDRLISENIVFVEMYDSSANNVVIECIVRNTPLLINPLEPVVEYLGEDYPFYFTSHDEAVAKASDLDLVHRTHIFLKNHEIKNKLTGEYFLKSFKQSEIFRNL